MHNNNKNASSSPAAPTTFADLEGVVVVGPEAFQKQIAAVMEPLAVPILARFDVAAAIASHSFPGPAGKKLTVLVITGRGLLRLLRQRRRRLLPAMRIIVVAPLEEMPRVLYYLEKDELVESLVGCIEPEKLGQHGEDLLRLALYDLSAMPEPATRLLLDQQHQGGKLARLDSQERDLLELIMTGASNAEIAAIMKLPLGRVRNRVRGLLAKLGCRSRTAAAILAYRYLDQKEQPK